MNTKTMTIHEALSELKVLDRRFESKLSQTQFSAANKHSNTKINGKSLADFVKASEENLQSMMDMLAYRKAIRNALSQSNAVTKITVAGKEYTIAEAIEMKKTGMNLYRALYSTISNSLVASQRAVDRNNEGLDAKADSYVASMYGARDKADVSEANVVREKYIEANTYEIVCMDNLTRKAADIICDVDAFFSEVDAKISVSNALTTITIEW